MRERDFWESIKKSPDSKPLGKKVIFDVVSSVKGGSGKSTFSLLLAAYYSLQEGSVAYVLDLDLRGTSWEKNYGEFIKTRFFENGEENSLKDYYSAKHDEEVPALAAGEEGIKDESKEKREKYNDYPFINSLMWNFRSFQSRDFWSYIEFKLNSKTETTAFWLCPAYIEKAAEVEQLEVDIFEHTIGQIIFHILDHHRGDESTKEVHIILDTPPNYEKHAEAVIKHLLANEDSNLFQMAMSKEKCFDVNSSKQTAYYLPYQVRLFLLCAISPAHFEQNSLYLINWLKDVKYSDGIIGLLKNDKVTMKYFNIKEKTESTSGIEISTITNYNRFKVCFVLNDTTQIVRELVSGRPEEPSVEQMAAFAKDFSDWKTKDVASYYHKLKNQMNDLVRDSSELIKLCTLRHLFLPAALSYFGYLFLRTTTSLEINEKMITEIKNIIDEL